MPAAERPEEWRRGRGSIAAVALLIAGASMACGSGCYRRVVGARGLGTSGTPVQQPNEPGFLDRLLGPEPSAERSAPRMRVN